MAAKAAKTALGGTHTAGIYSDMTVDGPEIGTLVVIVDRAKNLPNRKAMGKQDPYCAARLGKEAKKTETDKRGGQTPKWDQELRFNVHDSPDYYQLKVSVFNDDKRTELIGETWVALETIVIPGGGQNDVWHTLNCKGRYAGDIRIELTYYDTRPREDKLEKRRLSAPIDANVAQVSSGVGGPRQPKPVKRRPLPADPTDSSRSSPLPRILPDTQMQCAESPDGYGLESTPPPDRRHERFQNNPVGGSPLGTDQQQQYIPHYASEAMNPSPHQPTTKDSDLLDSVDQNDYGYEDMRMTDHRTQNGYHHEEYTGHASEYSDDWQSRPLAQPLQSSQGMVHSQSSPAMIDAQPRQNYDQLSHQHDFSHPKSYGHDEHSNHQYPPQDHYGRNADEALADSEEAPPPPPVHRNSGSMPPSQSHGRVQPEQQRTPIPVTAPLSVRNNRGSITGSPLSQIHSSSSNMGYALSTSSSSSQLHSQPPTSISSRTSYSMLRDQRSQSPVRDYNQSMPPSLVPGYAPSIAEDESERLVHEKRMSARYHYGDVSQRQLQQAPSPVNASQSQYQQSSFTDEPRPLYQQMPEPLPQSRPQPRARNTGNIQERRPHRSSAPAVQPQTASPDPRTPVRKSVSPQPGSVPATRRASEIPFSPDSFDAFNPSINATSSVNEPGARYNTPEQAKEATRQHERKEKLGDGPIIGNDGRVIDPSDHLPTDTWAPEPEQKTPKKGPQVTMRFRHSPQGAQPMPTARRPAIEHSVSTPIYTRSPDNVSPNATSRSRLQKKPRAAMDIPASSPTVPTLSTTPRNSPLRTSESNYPLRERENYDGYGSSPTYGRPSPGNIPPPIPGKIPIGSGNGGQEDWDTSALSEEMKRIDIGVGNGQGRQRRGRHGI